MRSRRAPLLLALLAGLAIARPARAADTSTLGAIEVWPNITTFGVYADVAGDDDGDASVRVEYRKAGAGSFDRGHALVRIAPGRWAGAVFFASPGTPYDVRVVLDDPDNGGATNADVAATTRANEPAPPTGATIWVDAALGDDGNTGGQADPLQTIQAAADLAGPGDTVRVRPGVYRETVTPPNGGTAGQPVWFLADAPGVIVDGSDPSLESPTWTSEGGDLWSAPFSGASQYVAASDARLYDYGSLAELQGAAAGLPGGYFVGGGRIYVRMPDGSDPSSTTLHVAVRDVGFLLDTIGQVVIDGFELRYFGETQGGVAVDVRDTHHAWVRNNQAHHMNTGFRVRRDLASENVIERNTFRDTSVWTWPWDAVKAHTPEASAVTIQNGRGNVVRHNELEGSFNGVDVGAFGTTDEAIAKDTDVYGNVLREHGDDGLEPEGACVNVRFWHNVLLGVFNGISVSPIEVGPTWFVRNLVVDYKEHAFKINNGSSGWIFVYHTTSAPLAASVDAQSMTPSEPFGPFVSRNNIYTGNRYAIESTLTSLNAGVTLDHDNVFTSDTTRFVKWMDIRYADLAELQASDTIEQNGFQATPSYVDPAAYDYDLTAGHPLLDQGLVIDGINSGFVIGAGPDVGAFELGGVSPFDDANPMGTGGGSGSGGGPGSGGGSAAGGAGPGAGGASGGGAGATGGNGSGDAGGASAGGSEDESGCGCRVAGAPARAANTMFALGLVGLVVSRTRRRRSTS